jgi:hypothetical protein
MGRTLFVNIECNETKRELRIPERVPRNEKPISPRMPMANPKMTMKRHEMVRNVVGTPNSTRANKTLKTMVRDLATL